MIAEPETMTPVKSDLAFHGSPRPTLGVELELAVLDRDNSELSPGAPRILEACHEAGAVGVDAELMQSMIELRTDVCVNIVEAKEQIFQRVRKVRNIATPLGYDLAMMGTHPFLRPNASSVTDKKHYQDVRKRLAWMTYHRVAFGLHVHVGVRSGDEAIDVMNLVMPYLPHLLALSANSPFWQGIDTGLLSCRAPLYGLVPHAGVPGVFQKWKEFRSYFEIMRDAHAYTSVTDIKWDIRPRPDLGTLEFRICDMPATLASALGLAALVRTLVIWAQRLMEDRPKSRRGDRKRQWLTTQNKWLAARYGLDAMYVRSAAGKRQRLRDDLANLLARLEPIAEETGDLPFLRVWRPIDAIEPGALRQRRIYRETGEWRALIADMTGRLAQELAITPRPVPVKPEPAPVGH